MIALSKLVVVTILFCLYETTVAAPVPSPSPHPMERDWHYASSTHHGEESSRSYNYVPESPAYAAYEDSIFGSEYAPSPAVAPRRGRFRAAESPASSQHHQDPLQGAFALGSQTSRPRGMPSRGQRSTAGNLQQQLGHSYVQQARPRRSNASSGQASQYDHFLDQGASSLHLLHQREGSSSLNDPALYEGMHGEAVPLTDSFGNMNLSDYNNEDPDVYSRASPSVVGQRPRRGKNMAEPDVFGTVPTETRRQRRTSRKSRGEGSSSDNQSRESSRESWFDRPEDVQSAMEDVLSRRSGLTYEEARRVLAETWSPRLEKRLIQSDPNTAREAVRRLICTDERMTLPDWMDNMTEDESIAFVSRIASIIQKPRDVIHQFLFRQKVTPRVARFLFGVDDADIKAFIVEPKLLIKNIAGQDHLDGAQAVELPPWLHNMKMEQVQKVLGAVKEYYGVGNTYASLLLEQSFVPSGFGLQILSVKKDRRPAIINLLQFGKRESRRRRN
ncbi:hypothetical protein CBS101457_000259 [Exobasidium rhododendri]|nr:hypothetical protein CBS101457_000259 [Exobasidium rhododendri]